MKTSCLFSVCNRSYLQGSADITRREMHVGEVVVPGEKLMQPSDLWSVFQISGESPTPSCGCVRGLASLDGAERDVILHVYDHRHVEFPVWGNYKEPKSRHVGSQVNVSAWQICLFHSLCLAATLSFTHAFLKSCQQQISANVIHYSVITNCGLHKSAYCFVKVQGDVSSLIKRWKDASRRKKSLGQTEDMLERTHLPPDLGKFWGSLRGAGGASGPPCWGCDLTMKTFPANFAA